MPARYSIVQYIPDPFADERINVGVVVFGEERLYSRFLSGRRQWRRVASFAGHKPVALQQFARAVEEISQEQLTLKVPHYLTHEHLERIAEDGSFSIRLTEPRGSLLDPERLLDQIANRALRSDPPRQRAYRGRTQAISVAYNAIQDGIVNRFGPDARSLLSKSTDVGGYAESHKVDVAIQNGHLLAAAHALSFEHLSEDLSRDLSLAAWMAADLKRERGEDFPVGLVVLPPRSDSDIEVVREYDHAQEIADKVKFSVVTEHEASDWAIATVADYWRHSSTLPPDDQAD